MASQSLRTRTIAVRPKTALKTAPAPPQGGARLPLGAHPGNTGGKKGRSGRPPKAYKLFARALYDDPVVRQAIAEIMKNSNHKHFASVFKTLLPVVVTTEDAEALAKMRRHRR